MILVVNCLVEKAFVADFNRVLSRDLEELGQPCRCFRVSEIGQIGNQDDYSHLIISGSEASTTEDQPWDQALGQLVHSFLSAGKPILGICYGHQFLAKALAGPGHVRRAAHSEFGWLTPRLEKTPLFEGLEEPEFMVCHFDEVFCLPGDFRVMASSDRCAVHAFQYQDRPVWGVQFHPEYGPVEAKPIFEAICGSSPRHNPAPPQRPEALEQRKRIFRNFLQAGG
jgi:GMP synthase-like glutamine amidotransferase